MIYNTNILLSQRADLLATTAPFFQAVWPSFTGNPERPSYGDILVPLPPEMIFHVASCMVGHECTIRELECMQQIASTPTEYGTYRKQLLKIL